MHLLVTHCHFLLGSSMLRIFNGCRSMTNACCLISLDVQNVKFGSCILLIINTQIMRVVDTVQVKSNTHWS